MLGLTQQMSSISTEDGAVAEGLTDKTSEEQLNPFASPQSIPGLSHHSVLGSGCSQLTSPQSIQAPGLPSMEDFSPHSMSSSSSHSTPSLLAPPPSPRSILLHGDGVVNSSASDASLPLQRTNSIPDDLQSDTNTMQSS